MPAAVSGVKAMPMPTPSSASGTATCGKYAVPAEMRVSQATPVTAIASPPMSRRVAPKRGAIAGTTRPIANITAVMGRKASPASSAL
jgi:hypothetical protein